MADIHRDKKTAAGSGGFSERARDSLKGGKRRFESILQTSRPPLDSGFVRIDIDSIIRQFQIIAGRTISRRWLRFFSGLRDIDNFRSRL